jgi:hypothetical protein
MAKPQVEVTNTFDEWRLSTNQISNNMGDLADVYTSPVASTGVPQNTKPADVILALNNLEERKLNEIDPVITGTVTINGDLDVNTGNVTGDGSGLTNLNGSNVTTGTVAAARLGSGTSNNTTILEGDNVWIPKTQLITDLGLATTASVTADAITMAIALG